MFQYLFTCFLLVFPTSVLCGDDAGLLEKLKNDGGKHPDLSLQKVCEDNSLIKCELLQANGMCSDDHRFFLMAIDCPKTCNLCNNEPSAPCRDFNSKPACEKIKKQNMCNDVDKALELGCPKTCGICDGLRSGKSWQKEADKKSWKQAVRSRRAICSDKHDKCNLYKQAGYCAVPSFDSCDLSCGRCVPLQTTTTTPKVTTTTPKPTTTTRNPTTMTAAPITTAQLPKTTVPGFCSDRHESMCIDYAKAGLCANAQTVTVMRNLCQKSCGYCKEATTTDRQQSTTKLTTPQQTTARPTPKSTTTMKLTTLPPTTTRTTTKKSTPQPTTTTPTVNITASAPQTTVSPETCKDINPTTCPDYVTAGFCKDPNTKASMKFLCSKACGFCIAPTTAMPCKDTLGPQDCFAMVEKGFCDRTEQQFVDMVMKSCKKSCGKCNAPPTTTTTTTTPPNTATTAPTSPTTTPSPTTQKPSTSTKLATTPMIPQCFDKYDHSCSVLGALHCGKPEFQKNCLKTCGFCGTDQVRYCDDKLDVLCDFLLNNGLCKDPRHMPISQQYCRKKCNLC